MESQNVASVSHINGQMKKVGIIAGRGELPLLLANKLKAAGRSVFILLVLNEADPALYADFSSETIAITKVGKFLSALKRENCELVTMAGPINRPNFKNIFPDKEGFKLLGKIGSALSKGDDGLLRAITEFIEERGFKVVGPHELDADFLVNQGTLGAVKPTSQDHSDILKGIEIVQTIGKLDIGQAIVIRNGYVLAVEAAEGTAAMLDRCQNFAWEQSAGVLVKLAKPGQELRADMPAIGVETIYQAVNANLNGIAIEARRTLIIDSDQVIEAANAAGIFIHAVETGLDV